jgi:hypothetical protein
MPDTDAGNDFNERIHAESEKGEGFILQPEIYGDQSFQQIIEDSQNGE